MTFRFLPAVLLVLTSAAGAQTPAPDAQPAWKAYQTPMTATAPAGPTPEHLQALAELADAMRVSDLLVAELKSTKPDNAVMADFDARFLAQLGPDEVRRRAAAQYATLFSLSEARELTAQLRSPAGGRAVQLLSVALTPGAKRPPSADAAAVRIMRDLMRTGAGKKLIGNWSEVKAINSAILNAWRMEYTSTLLKPSLAGIVGARREWIASGGKTEPVLFIPPPTGIGYVDAISDIMGKMAFRTDHGSWQLEKDIDELGIASLLAPKSLADVAGLPQRRAALDRIEQRIERFLTELDANLGQYSKALETVDMPFKALFMQGAQQGIEQQMAAGARVAENQRALIDIIRRILVFAESRKGKFSERKGTLVFAEQADLLAYNALVREAQGEGGRNAQLQADAIERLKKAADRVKP